MKRQIVFIVAAVMTLMVAFVGCAKKDVYVAGREGKYAILWKNSVPQRLSNESSEEAAAHSVFVHGDDVYVAGYEIIKGEAHVPMLWKNGVAQRVSGIGYVISVYVLEDDVFLAGSTIDLQRREMNASLWKNGEVQYLSDARGSAGSANSVFVRENDVFVAGEVNGNAKLWKNGNAEKLDWLGDGGSAEAVFVSDNNVYVAGYTYVYGNFRIRGVIDRVPLHGASLWLDGKDKKISAGGDEYMTRAESVFVVGNNIYLGCIGLDVGTEKDVAILVKNGKPKRLSDGKNNARAKSVLVSGNDVYVAGIETVNGKQTATLWKNNKPQRLSGGSSDSEAYSVFVK